MTTDYGAGRVRKSPLQFWLKLAAPLGLGVVVAVAAFSVYAKHSAQLADARDAAPDWIVNGPPCPATAPAEQGGALLPTNEIVFDRVTFARRFGHADCRWVATAHGKGKGGFPLCQFTGPAVLKVTTSKGSFSFAPGIGKPATVAVIGGVAQCVMGVS